MALGMEMGLGPGDFVFDGDPAPRDKGHSPRPAHHHKLDSDVIFTSHVK